MISESVRKKSFINQYRQNKIFNVPDTYQFFRYVLGTFYVRSHKFLHHIQESYLTLSNQYFFIILVRERYQFDAGFPYALEWQQLQYYTCIPSYFSFQNLKLFFRKTSLFFSNKTKNANSFFEQRFVFLFFFFNFIYHFLIHFSFFFIR